MRLLDWLADLMKPLPPDETTRQLLADTMRDVRVVTVTMDKIPRTVRCSVRPGCEVRVDRSDGRVFEFVAGQSCMLTPDTANELFDLGAVLIPRREGGDDDA
jgi:hypothetical protein